MSGIRHPQGATGGADTSQSRHRGGDVLAGGLSEVSKVLAARRKQAPPPPPPLTRAGALRLLEAARLALERFGELEETMNLAESAWALMFRSGDVRSVGVGERRGEGGRTRGLRDG